MSVLVKKCSRVLVLGYTRMHLWRSAATPPRYTICAAAPLYQVHTAAGDVGVEPRVAVVATLAGLDVTCGAVRRCKLDAVVVSCNDAHGGAIGSTDHGNG